MRYTNIEIASNISTVLNTVKDAIDVLTLPGSTRVRSQSAQHLLRHVIPALEAIHKDLLNPQL